MISVVNWFVIFHLMILNFLNTNNNKKKYKIYRTATWIHEMESFSKQSWKLDGSSAANTALINKQVTIKIFIFSHYIPFVLASFKQQFVQKQIEQKKS